MSDSLFPFSAFPRILVVDEDTKTREELNHLLTKEGYAVRAVDHGQAALQDIKRRPFDLVLCSVHLADVSGLELLKQIKAERSDVAVILMFSAHESQIPLEAMRHGAFDCLFKPVVPATLSWMVERALTWKRLQQENFQLREAVAIYKISEAMTQSQSLDAVLGLIVDMALSECQTDVAVLVLRDPVSGLFSERLRRWSSAATADLNKIEGGVGELDLHALTLHVLQRSSLLVHGIRALGFFSAVPKNKRWVSLCSVPLKIQDRIIGMLHTYSYLHNDPIQKGKQQFLSVLASRAAVSIEHAQFYEDLSNKQLELVQAHGSLKDNFQATVVGFAHALEENDLYTRGHSDRVSMYANLLGQALGLPEPDLEKLTQAALMHDIGKIGIRNEKLNKPGKLTPEELAMFRTHPAKGKRILDPIPFMADLIPGAFCHHENFDGSGYPQGLMGDNIPLIGRVVAIADTYDAMTSTRSYRKALPHQMAVDEIDRCAGSQFDARLVEVFQHAIAEYHRSKL